MTTQLRNRNVQLAAALIIALATSALHAATLLMHYDVNDPASWTGTVLQDLQGFGNNLTLTAGQNLDGTYAAPQYVVSGATVSGTPKPAMDRAYLDFNGLGVLTGSGKNQGVFNDLDSPDGRVQGYTMEGLFLIKSNVNGFNTKDNTGIGFVQGTSHENQFIYSGGGGGTLQSQSTVSIGTIGTHDPQSVNTNINSVVPRDVWVHIVKVHDPDAGQIRFYINGVLAPSVTSVFAFDGTEYWARDEHYGAVGSNGREVTGIGYSMTRFYRGALTDSEIYTNFLAVATVPEPATGLLMLGLTAAATLRRRFF